MNDRAPACPSYTGPVTKENYLRQAERITAKAERLGLDLNPVADLARLDAIEQQPGVVLPESYRVFLTCVTNGGDISSDRFGIYSIERSLTGMNVTGVDVAKDCPLITDLDFLEFDGREPDVETHCQRVYHAQDLLHEEWESAGSPTGEWQTSWDASSSEPPPDVAYYDAVCDQWLALAQGTIEVLEYGCGDYYRLVITGPSAGQIWTTRYPTDPGNEGFQSLRVDILTYCERWLHRLLAADADPAGSRGRTPDGQSSSSATTPVAPGRGHLDRRS